MTPTVLIIDDDPEFREDLAAALSPDFVCRFAATGEEGLGVISSDPPDAVVLDLVIEGGRSGLDILPAIRKLDSNLPIIMATGRPSAETEAEAIRRGALYYVHKAAGRAEIIAKLQKCTEVARTARERDQLRREMTAVHGVFLSASPRMEELDDAIDRIAAAPYTPVLITGESGTGKTLIAREIHRRSPRSEGPFLKVSMATLGEHVAPSELFGHVRGAFTGAAGERKGHFETARSGSIFLDEVGDLQPALQGQLLHAIEEREVVPVGSSSPISVDVRVIAATHRDLRKMVKQERFRHDLLGRLEVVSLEVPPLREHPEDIPDLVNYFIGKYAAEMGLSGISVAPDGLRRLQSYAWSRNNVRELRNTVERALVLNRDVRTLDATAFDIPEGDPPLSQDYHEAKIQAERVFKRRFFERAYRAVGGSLESHTGEDTRKVAELSGIPAITVRRAVKEIAGE